MPKRRANMELNQATMKVPQLPSNAQNDVNWVPKWIPPDSAEFPKMRKN